MKSKPIANYSSQNEAFVNTSEKSLKLYIKLFNLKSNFA